MKLFGQGVDENGPYDLQDWPIVETINGKVLSIPQVAFLPGRYDDVHTGLFPVVPDERVIFRKAFLSCIKLASSHLSIETGEFFAREI